ncbi:unnamed protein product [Rotaria sp. Silwood2]|nr:unnamed protein product [Rotaria sp. Silwood2]
MVRKVSTKMNMSFAKYLIYISLLSARFSRNGYCWLVSGQTAYVWLASSSNRITDAVIHQELKLPECALGQQANLMELFSMNADDGDCCSCLVITCDGYARYWRTIVRPNDFYDVKLEFDQIELLCHFKDDICVCGSYSGRLFTIPCNALCNKAYIRPSSSSSLLSSIGFGLKSMLFGTSRQMKDNEILRCLHSLKNDTSTQTTITMNVDLVSLTDKHLYFWYLAESDIQLVHSIDLQEIFANEAMKDQKSNENHRNISCISLSVTQETIYVLAIHHSTQDYRLMLGVFSLNHSGVQLVSFIFLTNHLNIRLHVAHFNNGIYHTKQILQQFGEKLQCAKAFAQTSQQSLYLQAAFRSTSRHNQISHISEVITTVIVGVIEASRTIEIQSYEEATRLLLIAFDSIQKYRQEHEQESAISSNPIDDEDFTQSITCQPWILYEHNLNDLYILHCTQHFEQALELCESREVRERLLTMISRLVYYVLDEYRLYICDLYSDNEINNDSEQRPWINYIQKRSLLIKIFIKLKEFSKGKQLAEEFEDYQSLIEICDELKDIEQLRTYIEQYGDKFMIVFDEYLRSKSALSVLFQKEYFDLKSVQRYLKSKPEFAWMVDIKNEDYEHASLSALQQVAGTIGKRQTLLAISKFALLASSHNEIRNAEAIKLRLRFIENEENLCQQRLDLLSNLDEDERLKQPLISAKDMIKVDVFEIETFFFN